MTATGEKEDPAKTPEELEQQERFKYYMSPEFTQRLLEHLHRAIKAALSEDKDKSG